MYNVKLVHYVGGTQVRLYNVIRSAPEDIVHKSELSDERICDKDGVVIEPLAPVEHKTLNPFTGELEKMQSFPDVERSQKQSLARTVSEVYGIARSNVWDWFITFTFNPDVVDSYDYSAVTKKLSKWFNNFRTVYSDCFYIAVPELHKSGRYHFHLLLGGVPDSAFVWSGKYVVQRFRTKSGRLGFKTTKDKIYYVGKYKFGFCTATRVKDTSKCSSYITKYLTKDLVSCTRNKKRYWASRNCKRAEVENLLLELPDRKAFKSVIADKVTWTKTIESEGGIVRYYELDSRFDSSMLPCSDS